MTNKANLSIISSLEESIKGLIDAWRIVYMWQGVVHRYVRWIGGLSHQSNDLSHLCNLLQKVVIHALLNTGFKGIQGSDLPD